MYRKLFYLTCSILVLGLVLTNAAGAEDPGLVGWWKLDESSGTIASDSSGNEHHGTVIGSGQWVSGVPDGVNPAGGLRFDGSPGQVDLGNWVPSAPDGSFSIAFWIKWDGAGSDLKHLICKYASWNMNDSMWVIEMDNDGVWRLNLTGANRIFFGTLPVDEWIHVALTYDGLTQIATGYHNGELLGSDTFIIGAGTGSKLYFGGNNANKTINGVMDDVRLYNRAITLEEILEIIRGISTSAFNPTPSDEATDISRDVVLNWTPGEYADTHDVYLGTDFDNVSNAAPTSDPGGVYRGSWSTNSYDAGRLDFSQIYYWRIDEVNVPPDLTTFRGKIWSFTVEDFSYPIPAESITVTASSQSVSQGPENTVNGSGLVDDLHSEDYADMWLSSSDDPGPVWIQYEFDKAYKLNEMLVWNYNGHAILSMYGLKDIVVEYSADAAEWTQLSGISEFAQATGEEGYAANTTVAFEGAAAKYVKITASSNWGSGIFNQYGLSEVRFMSIPVSADEPNPEVGTTDVAPNVTLSWKSGREAAEHNVLLSIDEQAVFDGTAPVMTVSRNSYSPPSLNLGSTYYWRVDEVNNAEVPSIWQGDIWNFSTQEYHVVDDFDSYNDIPEDQEGSNLIYITWEDGYANPSVNGSTMGYITGGSLETAIFYGGGKSAPLFYDNTTAGKSEVTANTDDLPIGRDWTMGSPDTLSLWIYGDPNNAATEQMYIKVNNVKVTYDGDLTQATWQEFPVELSSLGVDLGNVTQLTIGFERTGGAGGSGMVFIDEIRLYRLVPVAN